LEQRQFPLAGLRLYASQHSAGETISCGGVDGLVEPLDAATFEAVDLIFLAMPEPATVEWASRFEDSNAITIDMTQSYVDDLDVPLVVPEVNPHDLGDYANRNIVGSPDPTSIALAVVLQPIREAVGLRRVVVTTLEPVSGSGRSGIDELQRQTVALMQGMGGDEVGPMYPRRIAFNLFPQVGALTAGAASHNEAQTVTALRRILDQPDLPVSLTRLRVPLFYGQGLAIDIECQDALVTEAVVDLLRAAPGILLETSDEGETYPTPADVVGQDAVAVGRVRSDTENHVIDLWAVIDNVRKGAAVNAVQIAELLLRDHI